MEILKGQYKNISFRYSPYTEEKDTDGLLIINHSNGVESTHIINNWGITRIFQYIESLNNIV